MWSEVRSQPCLERVLAVPEANCTCFLGLMPHSAVVGWPEPQLMGPPTSPGLSWPLSSWRPWICSPVTHLHFHSHLTPSLVAFVTMWCLCVRAGLQLSWRGTFYSIVTCLPSFMTRTLFPVKVPFWAPGLRHISVGDTVQPTRVCLQSPQCQRPSHMRSTLPPQSPTVPPVQHSSKRGSSSQSP